MGLPEWQDKTIWPYLQGKEWPSSQGKYWLEDNLNLSTPHVLILNTIVNPIPLLTQVSAQKHHLEVLIGQMNLNISSPMLAGRLT